ncbi:hypothetical protein EKO04_000819 [Ascochyta lentis]|uniref:BTB domain-containing protein n=1 Tax=Ascochyta lentis TaxID=205686 RepID=A0A8H7JDQ5_9PLEO|nr:hypothetical protein EKO04_000819 [Ascochyta lentis]
MVGKGEKQQKYIVHEQLLTTRSLFFKKAMSGDWIEAKERIVKLPEDDSSVFNIYIDLLYTNKITVIPDSGSGDATGGQEQNIFACLKEQNSLASLYVLAEKLQDIDAKNKTLAAMVASAFEKRSDGVMYSPGPDTIRTIYEGTPPGCLLRKLLVDIYTSKATDQWIEKCKDWPDEFMRELLISVLKKRERVSGLVDITDLTAYMESR